MIAAREPGIDLPLIDRARPRALPPQPLPTATGMPREVYRPPGPVYVPTSNEILIDLYADGTIRVGTEAYTIHSLNWALSQVSSEVPKRTVMVRRESGVSGVLFAQVLQVAHQNGFAPIKLVPGRPPAKE